MNGEFGIRRLLSTGRALRELVEAIDNAIDQEAEYVNFTPELVSALQEARVVVRKTEEELA